MGAHPKSVFLDFCCWSFTPRSNSPNTYKLNITLHVNYVVQILVCEDSAGLVDMDLFGHFGHLYEMSSFLEQGSHLKNILILFIISGYVSQIELISVLHTSTFSF